MSFLWILRLIWLYCIKKEFENFNFFEAMYLKKKKKNKVFTVFGRVCSNCVKFEDQICSIQFHYIGCGFKLKSKNIIRAMVNVVVYEYKEQGKYFIYVGGTFKKIWLPLGVTIWNFNHTWFIIVSESVLKNVEQRNFWGSWYFGFNKGI